MLYLFLLLFSVTTLRIIVTLYQHKMKIASVLLSIFYAYVVLWLGLVIGLDVFYFGLNQSTLGELFGGALYHHFIDSNAALLELPPDIIGSVVIIAFAVFGSTVAYFFLKGGDICLFVGHWLQKRQSRFFAKTKHAITPQYYRHVFARKNIHLKHCRLNC